MDKGSALSQFLVTVCEERDESFRQASLGAGLDHAAISRFVGGTRPRFESCLKLARYFRIDQRVLLRLAGYDVDVPTGLNPERGSVDLAFLTYELGHLPEDARILAKALIQTLRQAWREEEQGDDGATEG